MSFVDIFGLIVGIFAVSVGILYFFWYAAEPVAKTMWWGIGLVLLGLFNITLSFL